MVAKFDINYLLLNKDLIKLQNEYFFYSKLDKQLI